MTTTTTPAKFFMSVGMTKRSANALSREGFTTLEEVAKAESLDGIKGLGITCMGNIREVLANHGYTSKWVEENCPPEEDKEQMDGDYDAEGGEQGWAEVEQADTPVMQSDEVLSLGEISRKTGIQQDILRILMHCGLLKMERTTSNLPGMSRSIVNRFLAGIGRNEIE